MTIRTYLITIAAVGAAALLWPQSCLAWGTEGHQIIAYVAATELTPAARAQVRQLLGNEPEYAMVEASTFADDIKAKRPETSAWHAVNIPTDSSGYDARRDCPRDACVVAQIERNERIVADRSRSRAVRAEALRFLIHFISDVHQPLNAADNRDRSAGNIGVMLQGRQTNMYAVWNVDLLRVLGKNGEAAAGRIQDDLASADKTAWQFGSAEIWANESFEIAKQEVYSQIAAGNGSKPIVLPREYPAIEENIVKVQLEKAALRLAWVLNRALN